MKYVTKIILIMTCLIIMLPFGGCGRKKQITAQKAGVLKPEAPGKEVLDHGEAVVDISNVAQGYVALRYKGSAKKISVEVIGKNNKVYKYFIERTEEPTYFPLTSGNGTYQISNSIPEPRVCQRVFARQSAFLQGEQKCRENTSWFLWKFSGVPRGARPKAAAGPGTS